MMFITKFPTPAILTYMSIISATLGISLTAKSPTLAAICMLFCAIIDMLDGSFAKSFDRDKFEKTFGVMIDSLADVLAFIALPVVFLLSIHGSAVAVVVATIYALCGITRLAVFTAETKPDTTAKYYRGLPVTVAGLAVPSLYIVSNMAQLGDVAYNSMILAYMLLSFLFIANIRVKKP